MYIYEVEMGQLHLWYGYIYNLCRYYFVFTICKGPDIYWKWYDKVNSNKKENKL
jgi:hypothetical protein